MGGSWDEARPLSPPIAEGVPVTSATRPGGGRDTHARYRGSDRHPIFVLGECGPEGFRLRFRRADWEKSPHASPKAKLRYRPFVSRRARNVGLASSERRHHPPGLCATNS